MKKKLLISMLLVSGTAYSAKNAVGSSSVMSRVFDKLSGLTPLHDVAGRNDFASFRVLLEAHQAIQYSIDKKDRLGRTPLAVALQKHGYSEIARYLLKAGARIDKPAVIALLEILKKQEAQKPGGGQGSIMAQVKAYQEHNKRTDMLEILTKGGISKPCYAQLVAVWSTIKESDVDAVKREYNLSFFFGSEPIVCLK